MNKSMYPLSVVLRLALVALLARQVLATDPARDVGVAQQELGKAQKEMTDKLNEPKPRKKPTKSVDEVLGTNAAPTAESAPTAAPATNAASRSRSETKKASPAPDAPAAETPATGGERVTALMIDGDANLLDQLGLRRDLEAEVIGRSFTENRARELAKTYEARLHDAGYYFASIAAEWPLKNGTLTLVVDQGRYGTTRVHQRGADGQQPYRGRFFSEQNIRNRLKSLKEGEAFNYAELYTSVYRINAHPDLTADVDLKPREEKKGNYTRRVVDMDFAVEDSLPLHGSLEFANDGTDVTDEWGVSLTLQYLNVSGVEDVLSLNVPVSIDLESIRSVSLGYYRPVDWNQGGSIALFGGYSELESESIVEQIGLEGEGWFVGAQGSYNLIDNRDYTLAGSLGISHSVVSDNLVVEDEPELDREVSLTPLLLLGTYVANTPDRWGGLTMGNLGLTVHSSSFPGASDDEEFELQRENAKADYLIVRTTVSRIQPVFADPDASEDLSWTLFTKLDGQVASEPLIPSEQKGLGGYSTVRGYIEREFLGDDGVNGTVELRTPLHSSSVFPKWFKKYNEKDPAFETVQGVLFLDAGYLSLKDSLAGEEEDYTIASVGLGFRIALGSHAQFRADWGFPLEETEDSDTSGRGHLSLQLLF
ncbi:MAG TPA: ShlB/FhaC/HecB family hemolysin secretion/activation protein [Kiritimatiellia bacterium]|nr:ShlB/FhaC/HecB family hemolysin secretion/activation protein [Kiritimatiellia bacterium]HMP32945.1 ShlB/FhaC/HecB family hemolysin secretion/activation protein [Kiritimatiellia bacterium]